MARSTKKENNKALEEKLSFEHIDEDFSNDDNQTVEEEDNDLLLEFEDFQKFMENSPENIIPNRIHQMVSDFLEEKEQENINNILCNTLGVTSDIVCGSINVAEGAMCEGIDIVAGITKKGVSTAASLSRAIVKTFTLGYSKSNSRYMSKKALHV